MRPGGAEYSRAGAKRLLVLGARAGQLGLLEAARARGPLRDRGRPRSVGARLPLRRPAGDHLRRGRAGDRPAGGRRAASTGSSRPASTGRSRSRPAIAERLVLPHPIDAGDRACSRPRSCASASDSPRRACRSRGTWSAATLEEALDGAAGSATPAWSRRPTARASGGSCSSRDGGRSPRRSSSRLRRRASDVAARRGARRRPRDDRQRVLRRRCASTPLTVTDRWSPSRPPSGSRSRTSGRARSHAEQVGAAVEAARGRGGGARRRDGPTYTQVRRRRPRRRSVVELAARLGGGHDAELCAAVLGVDLNELALAAALGEPVAGERLRPDRARPAAASSGSSSAPPGELTASTGLRRRRRSRASSGCGSTAQPGAVLGTAAARVGPRRRGPRRRGDARGGGGAGWPGSRLRTLRHRRCRRPSCRLERARPSSSSSRPRSATRRSPPSPSAPLGLADDRAARRRARAPLRRVRGREARPGRLPRAPRRCTSRSSRSASAPATR